MCQETHTSFHVFIEKLMENMLISSRKYLQFLFKDEHAWLEGNGTECDITFHVHSLMEYEIMPHPTYMWNWKKS